MISCFRLTKRIVLTRLPVGHTHEDIDALFGNIWTGLRNEKMITPQSYGRAINHAFLQSEEPPRVHDVICVPDYQKWILPYMGRLERYCTTKWTQLQWTFQAVDLCDGYPTGVKLNYRRFATEQGNVKVVAKDPDHCYGFSFYEEQIKNHPLPQYEGDYDGMHILKRLPDGPSVLFPVAFNQGSRKEVIIR